MKLFLTIFFFITTKLIVNAEAYIELSINSGNQEGIIFYTPSNGEFNLLSRSEIKTNAKGETSFMFDLQESGFVYIFPQLKFENDDWHGIQVYISPNSKISISLSKDKPDESLTFLGEHAQVNTFLNKNKRYFLRYINNHDKLDQLYVENSPSESYKLIESLKFMELKKLQEITVISQKDYNIIKSDINEYYTNGFYSLLLRHGDIETDGDWRIKEDWLKTIVKYKIIDLKDEYSKFSIWHKSSLDLKKNYLSQVNKSAYHNELKELDEVEKKWTLLNLVFHDDEIRSYLGDYLYNQMHKNQFNENTLYLYLKFKEKNFDYPNFEIFSKAYEEQLKFRDNNKKEFTISKKNYNSLKDICSDVESEFIFIDIWATWCGPCINEFSHSDNLKNFIKENPGKFTIVYLSIDDNKSIDEIENFINFHKLDGFHILATKDLIDEISQKFGKGGTLQLPIYSLISKDEEIIIKETSRPSQWNKLEKELKDVLLTEKIK